MIVWNDNPISAVVDCAITQQAILYTIAVYTGTEMSCQLLTEGAAKKSKTCFASASFAYADLSLSNKDDEGVDVRTTPIALASALCTALSGRRDSASATTFNLPGLYSTWQLYYAKNENHLAILCEMCGGLIAVRNDAWSCVDHEWYTPK
ncbi:unnamed protein product [Phytophthora fragariaefolia]|uniref:Unnamed protein product n=1 Tax=Phytophthora fragariaefolia TaxID=1490495 RepID=A0A9W6XM35_9STRA|nr:unnamed protein product [Phytophthora fragariaefolia]